MKLITDNEILVFPAQARMERKLNGRWQLFYKELKMRNKNA